MEHMLNIGETLYVTNRKDWRKWLGKNHKIKNEIWLIYYKKHTKKPRIPYDDAVEEALCYGWIDSIIKRIDDEKYVQKYTPRRFGSKWSKLNIERAKKMIRQKKMTKTGRILFKEVKSKELSKTRKITQRLVIPSDFKSALVRNKRALENFNNFTKGYKDLYIRYILEAKKKETRARRIKRVVDLAARNIKSTMF
ncbi:MAG: YdeI/OmpD-associated family protein [bacterium]